MFNPSVYYLIGETDEKEPDYVMLNKADNPIVFEVVKKCESMNEEQLRKLLNYLK